jgi:hypothetical protein
VLSPERVLHSAMEVLFGEARKFTTEIICWQSRDVSDVSHILMCGKGLRRAAFIAVDIPITLKIPRSDTSPCPIRGALPRLSARSSSSYYSLRETILSIAATSLSDGAVS